MMKKLMLTLLAAGLVGTAAQAQRSAPCATDEFHRAQIALHPEIAREEARMNAELQELAKGHVYMAPSSKWAKVAFDPADATKPWTQDNTTYYIPVVMHIIYDNTGTAQTITDNDIYGTISRLNSYYNATDPLLNGIVPVWKPYIGNVHIQFVLANKDPQGKPTRGILREFAYQTNGGDESAKLSQWPPSQYLNIYLENVIGRGVAGGTVLAYATFPSDYASNPYSQGVISRADQVTATGGNAYTLAHEIGHYLFLYHPWNSSGKDAGVACGDDEVDDTSPTRGHYSVCNLSDTVCSKGYFVDYDSAEYYHMTERTGDFSSSPTEKSSVFYNAGVTNVVGQSFTTGTTNITLQSISLRANAGSAAGNVTSLSLYNSTGTLIANSTNTPSVVAGQSIVYNFLGTTLLPNTTYKFVVNKVAGFGVFALDINDTNSYTGGTLFTGPTATTAVAKSDLYFNVVGAFGSMALDTVANNFVVYSNVASANIVGQTFTVGNAGVSVNVSVKVIAAYNASNTIGQTFTTRAVQDTLQSITLHASTNSISRDSTYLMLYKADTLIAISKDTLPIIAGQALVYNFPGTIILTPNTVYKFVVNRKSGSGSFSLDVNNQNPYVGGDLYTGNAAKSVNGSSDLYFAVTARGATIASVVSGNTFVAQAPGDSVNLAMYDASGATLLGYSSNTEAIRPNDILTFTFPNLVLPASQAYKFVVNRVSGVGVFDLAIDNTNPYTGGVMYSGPNASIAVPGSDLYFLALPTRLRRFDYPDTNNTQNIMDYSSCTNEMFTKGQVARMRDAMRADVRRPIMDTSNLIRTGIMDATGQLLGPSDITPTALYVINRPFTCRNSSQGITFSNRSYNDTIATADWTFDKGAALPQSSNLSTVSNTFSDTGWVTASLTVTGNNTAGSSTYSRSDLVYVADDQSVAPYVEEFNATPMLGRFPIFNYFNNPTYKWEVSNHTGYYDKTCMRFGNYDPRDQTSVTTGAAVNTATQSPRGLYADFYTPAYDLTGFGDNCFMSFFSSGAFRTAKNSYINDTLLISYSTNCGLTWSTLTRVGRSDLGNKGYIDIPYEPLWMGDWKEQSFTIPTGARSNQVYFRFRFLPGTDNAYMRYNGLDFGTGNNFYLDRLNITENPLNVKNGVIVRLGMSVQPNPTSGAATVRINGGDNSKADVNVTDVTGKLVYHTSVVRSATTTEIEIPAAALSVKGVYLVHVVTDGATETQKLVAY